MLATLYELLAALTQRCLRSKFLRHTLPTHTQPRHIPPKGIKTRSCPDNSQPLITSCCPLRSHLVIYLAYRWQLPPSLVSKWLFRKLPAGKLFADRLFPGKVFRKLLVERLFAGKPFGKLLVEKLFAGKPFWKVIGWEAICWKAFLESCLAVLCSSVPLIARWQTFVSIYSGNLVPVFN